MEDYNHNKWGDMTTWRNKTKRYAFKYVTRISGSGTDAVYSQNLMAIKQYAEKYQSFQRVEICLLPEWIDKAILTKSLFYSSGGSFFY